MCKNFIVQINQPSSSNKVYLYLYNLLDAFLSDSDLSSLPKDKISDVMTTLFLSTGSDYTSFFKNIGKATVLNVFFMHCNFISGMTMDGSLCDTTDQRDLGFLAFLRLVGTLYFKKHLVSFMSVSKVETFIILQTLHCHLTKGTRNF